MSAPDTPSTRAWWVLLISAKRSRESPPISQISHRGFDLSRRWEKIRPARSFSCSVPPGFGSAV